MPRYSTECNEIAASLRLAGARALDVRPSAAYAGDLSSALKALATSRDRSRSALAKAKTAKGQVDPAAALASAYAAAQRRVKPLKAPELARPLNGAIAGALGDIGAAYDRMADAARDADSGAFKNARAAVTRAESALARALDGLAGLGYKTSS